MNKENKLHILWTLFYTFFKVGLFTFGGGYAMIPIIEKEIVEKRKWMRTAEIADILAVSESTPGPIAVNTATYIGYRQAKIIGAIIATLGLILPSFLIIFGVSFVYKEIITWPVVIAAFKGIKIAVIILLINALLKIKKVVKTCKLSVILFILILICALVLSFLNITLPYISLAYIAIGLVTSLVIEALSKRGEKQ